jgi:hypothetical protein
MRFKQQVVVKTVRCCNATQHSPANGVGVMRAAHGVDVVPLHEQNISAAKGVTTYV